MYYAIVVAAGRGQRMGFKKQFFNLAGKPMWLRSAEAMLEGGADHVYVASAANDAVELEKSLDELSVRDRVTVCVGGDTRYDSVRRAVHRMFEDIGTRFDPQSVVAIHDAARPFVNPDDVTATFLAATQHGAAVLGERCRDTVKRIAGECVVETLDRESLLLAQTPQAMQLALAQRVYIEQNHDETPTDDVALLEMLGQPVRFVIASDYNGKVTTQADLAFVTWLAERRWGSNG